MSSAERLVFSVLRAISNFRRHLTKLSFRNEVAIAAIGHLKLKIGLLSTMVSFCLRCQTSHRCH